MATSELPEMPNGPILELYGQKKRFHVPHGLKLLLEEITTETLRYQPEDIYVFLAQYLDAKILKLRGPPQVEEDPNEYGDVDEETGELLGELHLKKSDADKYATKIQAAFRGHNTRRSLASKGKIIHKEHRKSWEWKKWGWEGPSELEEDEVEEMLDEFRVSKEDADKAATKIQAVFRGHRQRKSLEKQGKVFKASGSLRRSHPDYEEEFGEDGAFEYYEVEEGFQEEAEEIEEEIEQSEADETLQSNAEEPSAAEIEEPPPPAPIPEVEEETEEETEAELPTTEGSAPESNAGGSAGEDTSVFSEGEENEGPIEEVTEADEDTEEEG